MRPMAAMPIGPIGTATAPLNRIGITGITTITIITIGRCFRIGQSGRNGKGRSAIRHFHHHQFGIFAGGDGDRVLRPDGQAITRACFHAIDLR